MKKPRPSDRGLHGLGSDQDLRAVTFDPLTRSALAQECQGVLRGRVGQREDLCRGLAEDLRAGQLCGLLSEVRIADQAFCGGAVLDRHTQAADGCTDHIGLECTQAAAGRGDLADGLGDNLLGIVDVTIDDV